MLQAEPLDQVISQASVDGRRSVHWARKSPERIARKSVQQPYKVGEYGRINAIHLFEQHLDNTPELVRQVPFIIWKEACVSLFKGVSRAMVTVSSRSLWRCSRMHTTGTRQSKDHRPPVS